MVADHGGTVPEVPELPKGFEFTANVVGNIPVIRDRRVKEHAENQLKLYSPCSCGSGKKYKFCCNGREMVVIRTPE